MESFPLDILLRAVDDCAKGVSWKSSVLRWTIPSNKLRYALALKKELDNKTYKVSPYTVFRVTEPKPRIIHSDDGRACRTGKTRNKFSCFIMVTGVLRHVGIAGRNDAGIDFPCLHKLPQCGDSIGYGTVCCYFVHIFPFILNSFAQWLIFPEHRQDGLRKVLLLKGLFFCRSRP